MSKPTVITIGRQLGSGGREIGQVIAKKLGISFYDKELLAEAAKKSGLAKELFENHDEKPTNSFLYSLVMDTYSLGYSSSTFSDMPLNHKIFLAQFDTIKNIADRESCVIVGRCADYALADYSNVLSVFIHADLEYRIRRICKRHSLTSAKAKEEIVKTDKRRSSYYNYYTSKKWGEASGYHLCIDSSAVSIEEPRLARAERLAILLGSEGNGLSPETIACCDDTVRIPMAHGVDSLNVAAAGAVVFWQLRPRDGGEPRRFPGGDLL